MENYERLPFFVYGSLMPGEENYYLWEGAVVRARPGQFYNGCLYHFGRYPILAECEGGSVRGVIVDLNQTTYVETVRRIDELEQFDPQNPEKSTYRRVIRPVLTAARESLQVWVYCGDAAALAALSQVAGNDWAAYQRQQIQTLQQTWQQLFLGNLSE